MRQRAACQGNHPLRRDALPPDSPCGTTRPVGEISTDPWRDPKMTFNRKALSGTALAVLAVLFVAVMLLVNVAFRGARVDLTQNHLYTLSDGTKKIIASIDEPINLTLFFSDKGTQNLPQLRTYYTRVHEMLEAVSYTH